MQLKSHIWKPNAFEIHWTVVTDSGHIQTLANHTEAEWVVSALKTEKQDVFGWTVRFSGIWSPANEEQLLPYVFID